MTGKDRPISGEAWGEQLRQAIEQSPLSAYAIAQAAGIERSVLARFIAGGGISLVTAAKIGQVVGCRLVADSAK